MLVFYLRFYEERKTKQKSLVKTINAYAEKMNNKLKKFLDTESIKNKLQQSETEIQTKLNNIVKYFSEKNESDLCKKHILFAIISNLKKANLENYKTYTKNLDNETFFIGKAINSIQKNNVLLNFHDNEKDITFKDLLLNTDKKQHDLFKKNKATKDLTKTLNQLIEDDIKDDTKKQKDDTKKQLITLIGYLNLGFKGCLSMLHFLRYIDISTSIDAKRERFLIKDTKEEFTQVPDYNKTLKLVKNQDKEKYYEYLYNTSS